MGKRQKKEPDPPAGVPAWMATFSDLVTLLLTFFVMLMAMASFDDVTRVQALLHSLNERMGADGFEPGKMGVGEGEHMSPAESMAELGLNPQLAKLAAAFRMQLSDELVHTDQEQNELRVDLPHGAFFRTGESTVHPGGYSLLAEVSDLLASEPGVSVQVVGYAGNDEGSTPMVLATDRAVAVAGRMRPQVHGERLSLSPFGPDVADPMSPTEGHRRRIRLVLRTGQVASRGSLKTLHDQEGSDVGR